jgi:hypothetical protein
VLQLALREIRAKLAQGQALKPNLGTIASVGERRSRGAELERRLPIQ